MDVDSVNKSNMRAPDVSYRAVEKQEASNNEPVQKAVAASFEEEKVQNEEQKKSQEDISLEEEVQKANTLMETMNKDLKFELDERLENRMVVKVLDRETDEVIKQYPPEEMLEVMAKLEETILGVLVDDKA